MFLNLIKTSHPNTISAAVKITFPHMPKWRLRRPTRPVCEDTILPERSQAQTFYPIHMIKMAADYSTLPPHCQAETTPPIFGPASPYHYSKNGGACQALSLGLTPPPVCGILEGYGKISRRRRTGFQYIKKIAPCQALFFGYMSLF